MLSDRVQPAVINAQSLVLVLLPNQHCQGTPGPTSWFHYTLLNQALGLFLPLEVIFWAESPRWLPDGQGSWIHWDLVFNQIHPFDVCFAAIENVNISG